MIAVFSFWALIFSLDVTDRSLISVYRPVGITGLKPLQSARHIFGRGSDCDKMLAILIDAKETPTLKLGERQW
jgi:hypothetical protein